jgi:hypothetical protein
MDKKGALMQKVKSTGYEPTMRLSQTNHVLISTRFLGLFGFSGQTMKIQCTSNDHKDQILDF